MSSSAIELSAFDVAHRLKENAQSAADTQESTAHRIKKRQLSIAGPEGGLHCDAANDESNDEDATDYPMSSNSFHWHPETSMLP
jgi:hypothetical protein